MARRTDVLRRIARTGIALAVAAVTFAGATSAPASDGEFAACASQRPTVDHVACLTRIAEAARRRDGLDHAVASLDRESRRDARVAIDCHMAMHPIGEAAGRRFARDRAPLPLLRPTSFCHEGYVHGVQVAWLDAAPSTELATDGARACDSSDSTIDWACGHSFGHVLARRAGDGGMPTAIRWCRSAYAGAVHLGLDLDAWLTTCAKGALMEFTLADELAGSSDVHAHACVGVDRSVVVYCEAHAWLRAGLGTGRAATSGAQLDTCDQLASTRAGRDACAGLVGRGARTVAACNGAATDLRAPCRNGFGHATGAVSPAAVPAGDRR